VKNKSKVCDPDEVSEKSLVKNEQSGQPNNFCKRLPVNVTRLMLLP
jgi:hypothetical protein